MHCVDIMAMPRFEATIPIYIYIYIYIFIFLFFFIVIYYNYYTVQYNTIQYNTIQMQYYKTKQNNFSKRELTINKRIKKRINN